MGVLRRNPALVHVVIVCVDHALADVHANDLAGMGNEMTGNRAYPISEPLRKASSP
jgi:hypothetical protein